MSSVPLDTILLLGLGAVLAVVLLYGQYRDDDFDLRTLIVDESGKISLSKFGQFVALVASTWVLIHETRTDKLTEWLFAGYILTWAGANLGNKWISTKGDGK